MVQHLERQHGQLTRYQCSECFHTSSDRDQLIDHIRASHPLPVEDDEAMPSAPKAPPVDVDSMLQVDNQATLDPNQGLVLLKADPTQENAGHVVLDLNQPQHVILYTTPDGQLDLAPPSGLDLSCVMDPAGQAPAGIPPLSTQPLLNLGPGGDQQILWPTSGSDPTQQFVVCQLPTDDRTSLY